MGYSVSAAFGVLALSAIISFGYMYTSLEESLNNVVEAHNAKLDRDYCRLNSQIEITYINATQQGAVYDLELKVYNAGSEVLNSSKMTFIVNGTLTNPDYLSSKYLMPAKNLTVKFYSILGTGTGRIKVTTECGSSAIDSYEVM